MKVSNELNNFVRNEINRKNQELRLKLIKNCSTELKEYNKVVEKYNKDILIIKNKLNKKGLNWSVYPIQLHTSDRDYQLNPLRDNYRNAYDEVMIKLQYSDSIDLKEIKKMIEEFFK